MGFFEDINTFFKWRRSKKTAKELEVENSESKIDEFNELDKIESDNDSKKKKRHEVEKNYTKEEWLEKIRLRDEQNLKNAQAQKEKEEAEAIKELKKGVEQIEQADLVKIAEGNLKNKSEVERRTALALLNNRLGIMDEVGKSALFRIYELHQWLKKTDATKLSAENINFLDQKSASSGKNFYFDSFKFVTTGLNDQNAMLECFVCDHDGVKSADRVACIPLDIYSFCKCIEHSSFSLVEKMAKSINKTGYCPIKYASVFGWGKKERALIENALITRMLEIRSGFDCIDYGDNNEKF